MRRYAIYRGVKGALVAHPWAGAVLNAETKEAERTGRHVGQRKLSSRELRERFGGRMPTLSELEMIDRYEPIDEVMQDDVSGSLAKAVRNGELMKVSKDIIAKDLAEARAKLQPPAPQNARSVAKTASTKGGE